MFIVDAVVLPVISCGGLGPGSYPGRWPGKHSRRNGRPPGSGRRAYDPEYWAHKAYADGIAQAKTDAWIRGLGMAGAAASGLGDYIKKRLGGRSFDNKKGWSDKHGRWPGDEGYEDDF